MSRKEPFPMHGNHQDDRLAQQDLEIRERLEHIRNKLLIMSGKGGVGKSSVAAYLAVSLAGEGYRVGLMDPGVVRHGDAGRPTGVLGSKLPFACAFEAVVKEIIQRTDHTLRDKKQAQA